MELGKTTLFIDSVIFALFGRTIKNTNNQYLSNRNCSSKLKTFVKLYFEVDGINYISECYCKPYIKAVGINLEKYDEQKQEWLDITQSSVVKTRQYIIENILNCSFELFKSSIIVSASDCLNFYEGMTKQQKRNYIQNIFNLNCFGTMYNMIKSDINDLKKELTYNNNQIIKNTNQLEQLKIKFESFETKLNEDVQNIKNELLSKCTQMKQLDETNEELKIQYSTYQNESKQYKKINTDLKKLNMAKNVLEKQVITYQSKINTINVLLDEIAKIKQGLCQTCTELMNNRYNYNNKIKEIQELNSNISEHNQKIEKIDNTIIESEKKVENLQQTISTMNSIKSSMDKNILSIEHIKTDIKRLKGEYDSLNADQSNPFKELIKKTEQDLQLLKKQVTEYHSNIKHLDILKEACSQNGVKSFIIKDIVKLLNSLIQKYLNEIGAEYLVYFDESFEFKFVTMSGECEYSSFSAGQRQRIQIATIFAFRDLILNGKINANIFIIDEFLDSAIDGICIKNVLEILYKKTIEQHQNIFIISHRQETTENHIFNNIIQVIKQNGISTIKIN